MLTLLPKECCYSYMVKLLNAFCISEETLFPDFVLQWSRCMVKFRFSFLHEDLALVSCLGKVTFNQELFLSLSPLGRHLLKIFDSYLWIHSLLYVSDLADAM